LEFCGEYAENLGELEMSTLKKLDVLDDNSH